MPSGNGKVQLITLPVFGKLAVWDWTDKWLLKNFPSCLLLLCYTHGGTVLNSFVSGFCVNWRQYRKAVLQSYFSLPVLYKAGRISDYAIYWCVTVQTAFWTPVIMYQQLVYADISAWCKEQNFLEPGAWNGFCPWVINKHFSLKLVKRLAELITTIV